MNKKNKMKRPRAYAELTKDTRFEGTYEVLVPVPDRIKPHRVSSQFPTQKAAEDWIHSEEGIEAIDEVLDKAGVKSGR
jgi:hypothetical protein